MDRVSLSHKGASKSAKKAQKRRRSSSTSSSSSSSDRRRSSKKSKSKRKRKRSSSSSSSEDRRKRKQKKKAKKHKKDKKSKIKTKEKKVIKELQVEKKSTSEDEDYGIPIDLMNFRARAPETQEDYEARQSQIRRVYDAESGRDRLVKGDGEIIEEIVSKSRHDEINRQATAADGNSYQRRMGLSKGK